MDAPGTPPAVVTGFVLGRRSLDRLRGVHPDLVRVVKRAIQLTTCDFTVLEGVRSHMRQAELVQAGASQTMNSRHITGHAVDLGALVNGEVRWDWGLYYIIARAMQTAAEVEAVRITWGGVWDRGLTALGDPEAAVAAYVGRRKAQGKRAFLDGPHYQLDWAEYPAEQTWTETQEA
jgi:peptidoglycan L-alanyl-D-glutamate endopeptidase CwlK